MRMPLSPASTFADAAGLVSQGVVDAAIGVVKIWCAWRSAPCASRTSAAQQSRPPASSSRRFLRRVKEDGMMGHNQTAMLPEALGLVHHFRIKIQRAEHAASPAHPAIARQQARRYPTPPASFQRAQCPPDGHACPAKPSKPCIIRPPKSQLSRSKRRHACSIAAAPRAAAAPCPPRAVVKAA